MTIRIVVSCLLLCIFTGFVGAEEKPKLKKPLPRTISGITTVSVDELASMLASENEITVIDARIQKGRSKGYIDGSIHLPDVDTSCDSLTKHIPSKMTKVVFYCSSSECGRSMNAVTRAQNCGYQNLYWFREGFREWKKSGYPYSK